MGLTPLKLSDVRFASETDPDAVSCRSNANALHGYTPRKFIHSGAAPPRAA